MHVFGSCNETAQPLTNAATSFASVALLTYGLRDGARSSHPRNGPMRPLSRTVSAARSARPDRLATHWLVRTSLRGSGRKSSHSRTATGRWTTHSRTPLTADIRKSGTRTECALATSPKLSTIDRDAGRQVNELRQLYFRTGRWRRDFLDGRVTGSGRDLPDIGPFGWCQLTGASPTFEPQRRLCHAKPPHAGVSAIPGRDPQLPFKAIKSMPESGRWRD